MFAGSAGEAAPTAGQREAPRRELDRGAGEDDEARLVGAPAATEALPIPDVAEFDLAELERMVPLAPTDNLATPACKSLAASSP